MKDEMKIYKLLNWAKFRKAEARGVIKEWKKYVTKDSFRAMASSGVAFEAAAKEEIADHLISLCDKDHYSVALIEDYYSGAVMNRASGLNRGHPQQQMANAYEVREWAIVIGKLKRWPTEGFIKVI